MNVYEWMDAQLAMSFRGLYFNIFLTRRVCELTNGYLIKESGKDVSSYMINYSWILFTDTVSMNSDFDHLIVPSSFYAHYKWKINESRWQKIPEYLLVLTFFPFGNSTLKDHVDVESSFLNILRTKSTYLYCIWMWDAIEQNHGEGNNWGNLLGENKKWITNWSFVVIPVRKVTEIISFLI